MCMHWKMRPHNKYMGNALLSFFSLSLCMSLCMSLCIAGGGNAKHVERSLHENLSVMEAFILDAGYCTRAQLDLPAAPEGHAEHHRDSAIAAVVAATGTGAFPYNP